MAKYLNEAGVTTLVSLIKSKADETYAPVSHNHDGTYAPVSHNHKASDITSGTFDVARIPALSGNKLMLTGYSKPESSNVLAASDTVNAAFGKLEKKFDSYLTSSQTETAISTAVGKAVISLFKFKGTLGTGGTVTALPATHNVGEVYYVKTAGAYAGQTCEIGDMIICVEKGTTASNSHWAVINANWTAQDGSSTLQWGQTTTLATIGGVTIDAKLPTNPNTHYTSKNVVTSSATGTSDGQATNTTGVYLNHIETNDASTKSVKSKHCIKGSGSVSVSCDSSGNITIAGATYTSDSSLSTTEITTAVNSGWPTAAS